MDIYACSGCFLMQKKLKCNDLTIQSEFIEKLAYESSWTMKFCTDFIIQVFKSVENTINLMKKTYVMPRWVTEVNRILTARK